MSALNVAVCQGIVDETPWVNAAFQDAVKKVRDEHKPLLKHIAGHLYLDRTLFRTAQAVYGHRLHEDRDEEILRGAREAVQALREAKILPASPMMFSLAWFVFKWVIFPFIVRLLKNYSQRAVSQVDPVDNEM